MNVAPIARERSFVLGVTEDHDDRNLVRAGRQRVPMHAIEERLIRYVRSRLKRCILVPSYKYLRYADWVLLDFEVRVSFWHFVVLNDGVEQLLFVRVSWVVPAGPVPDLIAQAAQQVDVLPVWQALIYLLVVYDDRAGFQNRSQSNHEILMQPVSHFEQAVDELLGHRFGQLTATS
jgi:hypothetical protein